MCYIRQRQEEFRQIFMLSHIVLVCTTWDSRGPRSILVRNSSIVQPRRSRIDDPHVSIYEEGTWEIENRLQKDR